MPLIKSKSKKAFVENLKTEMHEGKSQPQSLAIAYSVKRKANKASGGSVQSGSKDMNMAEGGEISAKTEKRPMPDSLYNDRVMESHNTAKKALIDSDWTGQPTTKQAQSNNGRMVKPIKNPRMAASDVLQVRLRDDEADLERSKSPGPYDAQPPREDDEMGPNRQGPDNVDKSKPHSSPKSYAKGGKIEESDRTSRNVNMRTQMEPEDHGIQEHQREEEHDLMDMDSPSEDEGSSDADSKDEEDQDRQGPALLDKSRPHSANLNNYAEGGHIEESEDNYADNGREDSIAAAIMARRDRLHDEIDSGAHDMDAAARYAEGGEILSSKNRSSIKSHGSTDSDDSDTVDLSRNADEDANEEDQLSFDALKKENYSETPGLDQLDQPEDSNLKGDEREEESENKNDRVSAIRSKMMAKRQFKSR